VEGGGGGGGWVVGGGRGQGKTNKPRSRARKDGWGEKDYSMTAEGGRKEMGTPYVSDKSRKGWMRSYGGGTKKREGLNQREQLESGGGGIPLL